MSVATNVGEIADRERRKNNLIVYNLKETSPFNRVAEMDAFTNLCRSAFSLDVKITKVLQLGKKLDDKIRPLLIGLDSEDTILSNSPHLRSIEEFSDVFISPDLTNTERERG